MKDVSEKDLLSASIPEFEGGMSWYVWVVGTDGEGAVPDREAADPVAGMYG